MLKRRSLIDFWLMILLNAYPSSCLKPKRPALGMTQPGIGYAVSRGEKIAKMKNDKK